MPVKTDRLIPLLVIIFGSYWLLKNTIQTNVRRHSSMFTQVEKSTKLEKYKTSFTYKQFLNNIQHDDDVLEEFIDVLKTSHFKTYFFETPSITKEELDSKVFEFVLVDAPALEDVAEDEGAFREYFSCDQSSSVVSFMNLGGDAKLVAPCPNYKDIRHNNIYSSLAPFMRQGAESQIKEFWRLAASVTEEHVGEKKTWMSTSGLGVYWLHLRLDSRPKYYTYKPYTVQ